MKPLAALIGLGIAGALVALAVKHAPKSTPQESAAVTLDPGIDAASALMVQRYLAQGTDPNEMTSFASKLQAAGYSNSAIALRAKAMTLRPLV